MVEPDQYERQNPAALAGKVDARAPPEAEPSHPFLQPRLAEVLRRDLVGADVGRALEDLPDVEALRAVRFCVVDHAVGHVQRARDGEHRARRDVALRERSADRHDLEDRPRLEDVVDRVVDGQAVRVRRRKAVRVVARLLRHREDRAGSRIHDDRRRVLRVPLRDRLREDLLGVRLDAVVEREEDVPAVHDRLDLLRVDDLAERVPDDDRLAGRPLQHAVQSGFKAAERLIDAHVAEHRRRDRPLRVDAPLIGLEGEPGEILCLERGGPLRRRLRRDDDVLGRAVRELLEDPPVAEPEHFRRDTRLLGRRRRSASDRRSRRSLAARWRMECRGGRRSCRAAPAS